MAATTTTLNGNITASQTYITLTAYTAPTLGPGSKAILQIDDELFLVTDASLSPTLGVVRGYMGSAALKHQNNSPAKYGVPGDMQVAKGPYQNFETLQQPTTYSPVQEITATGTTGSNAATVTALPFAFLNITGAASSGINLPYPLAGAGYTMKNSAGGSILIYCTASGAKINGNAGATGFTLTSTGNLMADAFCTTAGTWQIAGNT